MILFSTTQRNDILNLSNKKKTFTLTIQNDNL